MMKMKIGRITQLTKRKPRFKADASLSKNPPPTHVAASTNPRRRNRQGIINKLWTRIDWEDHPGLNVSAAYLDQDGIGLTISRDLMGENPHATITINLLKTQRLAAEYLNWFRVTDNIKLGTCVVFSDSKEVGPFKVAGCKMKWFISNFSGKTAKATIVIEGRL